MKPTASQLAQFHSDGFLLVPHFFSEREVRAMRLELDRLRRDGFLRNVATDGDGETHSTTKMNLQICPMHDKSTFYRALAFHPKVVAWVRALIGDPVLRHLDQSFLKPARCGAPTNWHQDNAYFQISDPLKGTAMWTAIHDATLANGTMRLIPGSHREKLEHSRDPESDHHIRCYPDESKAVAAELPAGGVAFFCYGAAHATGCNNTDSDRAGVAYHFLNADYATEGLLDNPKNPIPYLTGPQATGGLREYGVKVEGTFEAEATRVLEQASVTA
ncbi:MAG: phytanoyl-CoA dioxygenase family protein [Candidatus Hydrogenedentes bacterium]|nr:phytanoyl-CoA dioxygenase family protein [Candidatus Hydrogenedentota bacterium]